MQSCFFSQSGSLSAFFMQKERASLSLSDFLLALTFLKAPSMEEKILTQILGNQDKSESRPAKSDSLRPGIMGGSFWKTEKAFFKSKKLYESVFSLCYYNDLSLLVRILYSEYLHVVNICQENKFPHSMKVFIVHPSLVNLSVLNKSLLQIVLTKWR